MNSEVPNPTRRALLGILSFRLLSDFRFRISVLLLAAFFFLAAPFAFSADLSDEAVLKMLTTDQPRDKAIRRGLEFLRKSQRADGLCGEKFPVANTSLAIMAHFAAGHTLEDPQFGASLRRALSAVLTRQDDTGYFGQSDGSNMYGHGITALMLAEAIGMTRDDDLEEKMHRALERALRVTINAAQRKKKQGAEGGWRYSPNAEDSDLSLSGWQLMSLHAAQQVGLPVPEDLVHAAVDFAKRVTSPEGRVGYERRGEDRPALRGLALLCFVIGHQENSPEVAAVTRRILREPIRWEGEYLLYRAYYDAVGLSRAAPEEWLDYAPKLEKLLLDHQRDDGSWDSPSGELDRAGAVYTTSMAVLALAVQRHVLPAYQR
jgi:hypothetical protein